MRWTSVYGWLLTLILCVIFLQFFLAGAGSFGATDFDLHVTVGTALMPVALVLLGLALLGRRHVTMSVVLLVLLVLQWVLGTVGSEEAPWFGAVHGLNALAVGGVAGILMGRVWRAARARHHVGPPQEPRSAAAAARSRSSRRQRTTAPSGGAR